MFCRDDVSTDVKKVLQAKVSGQNNFWLLLCFPKDNTWRKITIWKKSLLKKYLNPHFIREGIENKSNFSAARRMWFFMEDFLSNGNWIFYFCDMIKNWFLLTWGVLKRKKMAAIEKVDLRSRNVSKILYPFFWVLLSAR